MSCLDVSPAQLMRTTLAAIGRRFVVQREPTITDMLSDSIVRAVMKADRIDPEVLAKELRAIAQKISTVRQPRGVAN